MPLQNTPAPARKGLSREEMKAITDRVLGYAKADFTRVTVNSGVSGLPGPR